MKNNKQKHLLSFWQSWTHFPDFFKNLFVFLAFFIFFTISIVLIWKRQLTKETRQVLQSVVAQQIAAKAPPSAPPPPPPPPPQQDIQPLINRIAVLETRLSQSQASLQIPHKLIAFELIKGILEGFIPLESLKTFLQKTPDPWASSLLVTLATIGDIKDYPQLEASLALPPPLIQLSLWQRVKRKLKSLVRIQRLDEKGNYKFGNLEDVQKALQDHNIQKAIECFEKLPVEDQAALSSWKKTAQDRLFLETTRKTLLLEITGG